MVKQEDLDLFKVGDKVVSTHDPKLDRFYRLKTGVPYTIIGIKRNTGLTEDIWPYLYVLDISGHDEFYTTGFALYEEEPEDNTVSKLFEEKVKLLRHVNETRNG